MTNLVAGLMATPVKQSDPLDKVRSTVTTVTDDVPSVATGVPEQGNLETDPNTDGGLTPHAVASKVTPREKYAPATESRGDHMTVVNARISSSGTAAAREAAGEWGHGTLPVYDAMTRPADGTAFDETYFKREERGANATAGAYMTPHNEADQATLEKVQQVGKSRAREDNVNIYQAMYSNLMNGVQGE